MTKTVASIGEPKAPIERFRAVDPGQNVSIGTGQDSHGSSRMFSDVIQEKFVAARYRLMFMRHSEKYQQREYRESVKLRRRNPPLKMFRIVPLNIADREAISFLRRRSA